MKDHHLSVTTLEEYEPNPEFIGRNFNNGEIIQLVIKSKSGAWLPLNMIQMVMMHELAHNTHMNHGKGFWQTRNLYANEMRLLWGKGYTGEGLWGQGRTLVSLGDGYSGNFARTEELAGLPLCGGTYRSRRRKRKVKQDSDLTWKEKRDRRIEKKFGKNGAALGEDEDKRLALELRSKGPLGVKPRVAQSKRGRELRAAAALARFATNKRKNEVLKSSSEVDEDETESETEYDEADTGIEDAKDFNGRNLIDSKGQPMIKICEAETSGDMDAEQELRELTNLDHPKRADTPSSETENEDTIPSVPTSIATSDHTIPNTTIVGADTTAVSDAVAASQANVPNVFGQDLDISTVSCSICSMRNSLLQSTCSACSHVLDARKDPRHWACASDVCKGTAYRNAGDCGVCGICGTRKPSIQKPTTNTGQPRFTSGSSAHIAYL